MQQIITVIVNELNNKNTPFEFAEVSLTFGFYVTYNKTSKTYVTVYYGNLYTPTAKISLSDPECLDKLVNYFYEYHGLK